MDWREAYAVAGGAGRRARSGAGRSFWPCCALMACAAFLLPLGVRALEIPLWNNPSYMLEGEYLLATQDAYHWIAGAEGFEFGAGHPMAELIRYLSLLCGMPPANVGFWLPLFLGSLLSVAVFFWAAALGFPAAGMVAGALASLSPGFLARTMLGYCDTDLVILLFGLLLGFVPMLWLRPWLSSPAVWIQEFFSAWKKIRELGFAQNFSGTLAVLRDRYAAVPSSRPFVEEDALSPFWLMLLVLAGLCGYYTQGWHSFFPYAVRFSALLLPVLIVIFGPKGGRWALLNAALCHELPLLMGLGGAFFAIIAAAALRFSLRPENGPPRSLPSYWGLRSLFDRLAGQRFDYIVLLSRKLFASPWVLGGIWLIVAALLVDMSVWETLLRSIGSYIKTTGEQARSAAGGADPLVYPAVAQSISEVQNLSFVDFLQYFHKYSLLTMMGLAGYVCLLLFFPQTTYLALMMIVGLSSLKLGGRMAMFSSPALALGLCLSVGQALSVLLESKPESRPAGLRRIFQQEKTFDPLRGLCSFCLAFVLVWPAAGMVPEMSKGPIISRDQAKALAFLRDNSPEDSMVWNWWDWGYAAHHFARRKAISDGARHGGPSLYVPAAVYAADDAHFARQLMAYTSEQGGEAGDGFDDLSGNAAAALLADLESGKKAPAPKSKQYLVVSADLVPLGFWVSTYGTWDFKRKEGKGYFISSIPQSLQYSLDTGVVLIKGQEPTYAASIDVFGATDLKRQAYSRGTDARFAFNTVNGDKLLMHNDLYNTLLYQLLVAKPEDSRFAPYFKLVYDTPQARIYEMR